MLPTPRSQQVGGRFRQLTALTLDQADVRRQFAETEPLDQECEAIGEGVDVGVVDLVRIAGENDLGSLPDARDDRFDLERRQILGFVDDEKDFFFSGEPSKSARHFSK